MSQNFIVRCYLTKEEFEKIHAEAATNGFPSASSYMRFLAFNSIFGANSKIQAIYEKMVAADENKMRPGGFGPPLPTPQAGVIPGYTKAP
jgi:hypothetical protein